MLEALLIYLYLSLGKIVVLAVVVGSCFPVLWYVVNSFYSCEGEPGIAARAEKRMLSKLPVTIFVVAWLLFCLVPSKDDLLYIVGGAAVINAGKYTIESEEAQKLPDNVLKAANTFLESVQEEE